MSLNKVETLKLAEIDYLTDEYSIIQLSKKYNISRYVLTEYLRKKGIQIINKQNIIKWDVLEVRKLNEEGISLSELSKKYNISIGSISVLFKRRGYKVINRQNELKFDNTLFEEIDTQEKAYWLGFIYADGYVSDKNGFELSLALKDQEHLQKFANFFKHPTNVRVTDNYRCRFSIRDKHLKETLIKQGCIPRKSLVLEFPTENQVPKHLLPHFIRGYFDGDGCIITKETSNVKLRTSLLGTKNVLLNILKESNIQVNILNDGRRNSRCCHFNMAIEKSEKFLNYIYKDSEIHLNRKYNLYQNYLKTKQI